MANNNDNNGSRPSGLLTHEEHLWDIALRGIGISLPDEYILRLMDLLTLQRMKGLADITLDELATIERSAAVELKQRIDKAREEPAQDE